MTSSPAAAQHLRDLRLVPAGRIPRPHRPRAPRTVAEMMAKGTYASINRASDAEVVQEPTEQPYGVRECAFRDPADNLIRIQQS